MSELSMSMFATKADYDKAVDAKRANKRVVHYRDPWHIVVGKRAEVTPVDHPDLVSVVNDMPARTSVVLDYDPITGVFETENSIYKPVDE